MQEPPVWVDEPEDVRGVEQGTASISCRAEGSPLPYYTWTDRTGNDVTRKPGEPRGKYFTKMREKNPSALLVVFQNCMYH